MRHPTLLLGLPLVALALPAPAPAPGLFSSLSDTVEDVRSSIGNAGGRDHVDKVNGYLSQLHDGPGNTGVGGFGRGGHGGDWDGNEAEAGAEEDEEECDDEDGEEDEDCDDEVLGGLFGGNSAGRGGVGGFLGNLVDDEDSEAGEGEEGDEEEDEDCDDDFLGGLFDGGGRGGVSDFLEDLLSGEDGDGSLLEGLRSVLEELGICDEDEELELIGSVGSLEELADRLEIGVDELVDRLKEAGVSAEAVEEALSMSGK